MTLTHIGDVLKVAYLGPKGSFSHQAVLQLGSFSQIQNAELISHPTIPSLFSSIRSGSVDRSVVPLGNSTNGPVKTTLDLLTTASQEQLLDICGETTVLVRQCLAGKRRTSHEQSGSGPYSHVTSLHTHPQAWTQCSPFLDANFDSSVERIDEDSTSAAAELVSKDETGRSAAICSFLAAEVFGLEVLAANIHEDTNNETRFIVLQPRDTADRSGNRTLLVFQYNSEQVDWVDTKVRWLSKLEPPPMNYSYSKDIDLWMFYFWDTTQTTHQKAAVQLRDDLKTKGIKSWNWGPWIQPLPDANRNNGFKFT